MKHTLMTRIKEARRGHNSTFRRIMAVFFCLLTFAILLFPASPYADAETPGTVSFAKWTKVKDGKNTLPRSGTNYIFVAYPIDNVWYCWPLTDSWKNDNQDIVAWKCTDHSEIDAYDYTSDVFYTKTGEYGSASIEYHGWDCNDAPEYYFKMAGGSGSNVGTRWDNDSLKKGNKDDLCITTHENGGSYSGCASQEDSCGIYRECTGYDAVMRRSKNIIYLHSCNDSSDYSSGDWFYIWIRSEVKFDAFTPYKDSKGNTINSYTVRSGSVLNMGDNVFIDNDFTITIEPGAVMSVDGTLFNNGKIICYGTVIIQEGASMGPFFSGEIQPMETYFYLSSNSILGCEDIGGEANLVIMKNGKFALHPDKSDLRCIGASIYNCGIAVLGYQSLLFNTTITNEGYMVAGYVPSNYLALNSTEASYNEKLQILILKNGIQYGAPNQSEQIPFNITGNSSFYNYGYANFTGNVEKSTTGFVQKNTGVMLHN